MIGKTVCTILLALGSVCYAQVPHRSEGNSSSRLFGGYSLAFRDYAHNQDNDFTGVMNGWEIAYSHRVLPWTSVAVDGSGFYRSDPGVIHPHTYFFMAGPEIAQRFGRHRLFVHGLIGGAHMNGGYSETFPLQSDFTLAEAIGGGIDTSIVPRIAWRVSGDFLHTNFTPGDGETNQLYDLVSSNGRISTGIVLRF